MNQQISVLFAKLTEAGCRVETAFHFNDSQVKGRKITIWRNGKQPVFALILDHAEDGYSLYLSPTSIKIDDDVRLILDAE